MAIGPPRTGIVTSYAARSATDQAAFFTSATIFCAASPRLSALTMARPELFRIALPSATLVPSRAHHQRHLQVHVLGCLHDAVGDHVALHDPAKMFTRIPSTAGSLEDDLERRRHLLGVVAPPPTSRKLAGNAPFSVMMSSSPWQGRAVDHAPIVPIKLDVGEGRIRRLRLRPGPSSVTSRSASIRRGGGMSAFAVKAHLGIVVPAACRLRFRRVD